MGRLLTAITKTLDPIEAAKSVDIPEFVNLPIASKLFPKPKTRLTFS
jgi:hypothetical protein